MNLNSKVRARFSCSVKREQQQEPQAEGQLGGASRRAAACGADAAGGRQPLGGDAGRGAAFPHRSTGPHAVPHGRSRHRHAALLHERAAARGRSPYPGAPPLLCM